MFYFHKQKNTNNSSKFKIFNENIVIYGSARRNSWYSNKLEYINERKTKQKQRKNIIWFNPILNNIIITKIGKYSSI